MIRHVTFGYLIHDELLSWSECVATVTLWWKELIQNMMFVRLNKVKKFVIHVRNYMLADRQTHRQTG